MVNCAGMWARQLGELAGVSIPLQAAEHYYLLTEPIEGVDAGWPVLEDPANYGYYREEGGGLMLGLFEPACAPWNVGGRPGRLLLRGDCPRTGTGWRRTWSAPCPGSRWSEQAGIKKFFCGPESFTPDLLPIVGEAPELKNYFVAAGLNSIGILTGGGIGRVVAHWIADGRPDVDVTGINIDRLHRYQANPEYRATRTVESLGLVYATHYPGRSMTTARGAKVSPVHHRLVAQRAYFRDVSGWEGADWYAPEGAEPEHGPLSWGRPDWFGYWEAEHHAARTGVILMDMAFMAKFDVRGRDAGRVLERISANQVDGEPGRITYTQWLNPAGTLEADLTVTKLGEDRFWVVASDTAHRHAETWMRRHIGDAHAFVTDVTSGYAQINIQGPRSRELLALVTSADMSNEAFPFRTAAEIDIGFARVLCIRITYLGELGYELYIPAEHAVGRLRPAGRGRERGGPAARGPQGARQPADGEGLPRLRPRHRQHRHRARGRAGLRGRARQAGRLHRPRRRARPEGARPAAPAAGPGAADRPRAADVPRRGGPPRRQARRVHPVRVLRIHPRRCGRAGDDRRRRAHRPGLPGLRRVDGTDRRPRSTRPSTSLRPMYDPGNKRIRM